MLKPRVYTISSSNKAYPKSIHMTISLHEYKIADNNYRSGITS